MTIKSARADDHWRRAFAREYPNRYDQLDFNNLFCLGTGQIRFRSGITAVIGGNGVGKSTLAMALGEVLEKKTSARFLASHSRMCGSDLVGELAELGVTKQRKLSGATAAERSPTGDAILIESSWLDPGFWAFHTRAQIVRDQNFADLLESLTPTVLDKGDTELLSYLVGKRYEKCLIAEIPDYGDFDRFPYFQVESDGVAYGSEAMGQGELALLLVFWVIRDLKSNSILILEEPETHVSPRAQEALMNVLARACDKKGIWVIVTTHSPTIVSRIPIEHVRVLVRNLQGVAVIESAQRHQVAALLGGGGGYGGVVLVEDDCAQWFVTATLEELHADLLRQLEVVVAGSVQAISDAVKSFPRTKRWFRLIGAYDGDQRGKVTNERWPVIFLPGSVRPEKLLRDLVSGRTLDERVTQATGRSLEDVLLGLEATAGRDDHDWLPEFSRALNLQQSEVIRCLVRVWASVDAGRAAAEEFVSGMRQLYNQ